MKNNTQALKLNADSIKEEQTDYWCCCYAMASRCSAQESQEKCKLSGRILKDEVCARGTANGLPRYEFQEPKRDKNKTPHP